VLLTVVYDANVLYSAPLRDLLLEVARTGEFRARYSAEILDEVFNNLVANHPELDAARLERTRELMEEAIPDALVTGHLGLVDALELPDPDDRHVLAAAIRAGADVIVTSNVKDFPPDVLAEHGIEAQHPDVFLAYLTSLRPEVALGSLERISQRLRNPPQSVTELVATLERVGCVQTAAALRELVSARQ
jgi:predicted nucleic acid-binding protein